MKFVELLQIQMSYCSFDKEILNSKEISLRGIPRSCKLSQPENARKIEITKMLSVIRIFHHFHKGAIGRREGIGI